MKKKILKGDKVKVISGFYKGKISEVIGFTKNSKSIKVILKDLNKKKVFITRKVFEENKVNFKKIQITRESGIDISNIVLLDENQERVKIGYKYLDKNKPKIRINKLNGKEI